MSAAKAKSERASAPDPLILALEIIAETGWRGFSFGDLAERAELSMGELRKTFSGRAALLDALNQRLDQAMLAVDAEDMQGLPPKDRVFELIMSRLEAMAPFRAGLCRLMRDARCDLELLAMTACRIDRSLAWLQDAASLDGARDRSPLGLIRRRLQRRVLGAVYLQVLRVWAADDSTDLAKTMASLDKQLRRIETLAGLKADAKGSDAKGPQAGAGTV
jgi:AcrR family transcriptional regulator